MKLRHAPTADQILISFRTDRPGISAVIIGTPGNYSAMAFVDRGRLERAMADGKPVHLAGAARISPVREIDRVVPLEGPLPRLIVSRTLAWAEPLLANYPAIGADRENGDFIQDPKTGLFGAPGDQTAYVLRGHDSDEVLLKRRIEGTHDIAAIFEEMCGAAGLDATDVGSFRRVARTETLQGPADWNGHKVTLPVSEGGDELIFALRMLPIQDGDAAALLKGWFSRDKRAPYFANDKLELTSRAASAMQELIDHGLVETFVVSGQVSHQLTEAGMNYPISALPHLRYGIPFPVVKRADPGAQEPSPGI